MNTTDLVSKSEDGTPSHNFHNEMPSQNTWTDEETEEEAMEDVLKYEDTLFPVSTDQQDGFSSDSSWDDEERDFNADADKTRKITHAEKVRTFKLRKKLDQLDSMRQQKDHDLLKAREELRACHMRIAELKSQLEEVEKQILEEQNSENIAAMFRLRALHKRLGIELQGEEELESQIAMAVKENEMEQCELEVQQRKFKHVLQEVQLNEEIIERQRNWEATQRLQREEAAQIRKLRSQKNIRSYYKINVFHFMLQDFEVGKSYKKKILLTNVSYSINFCKLLGISEHLQDFISVQFTPPGPMSAGMTCDLVVIFKPKINEDMFGEVKFLAQTGAFTVPVKCTIKKCELAVDINFIDFGTNVIGETISRTITLTNSGALGTQFHLVTTSGSGAIHLLTEPPTVGDLDTQDFECSEISFQESRSQKDDLEIYSEKPSRTSMVKRDSDTSSRTQKIQEMPNSTGEEILHEADPTIENESLMSEQPKTDRTEKLLVTHSEPVIVECDEIQIEAGNGRKGEIAPYGCIKLQVIFTPIVPGEVHMSFDIVFSDPNSKSIPIHVCGVASDMPVWVTRPNIDFKICMYDRLYQDSISVRSRSNISLQLTFEVCKELRNHMEILPKTGFIQAQSTFNAQLKFLPRQSLADDAEGYFDKDTGVLEVPMIIHVADQTRAIPFAVHAVVTTSDLEFNKAVLDFGHCSLFHSVQFSIQITNHSLLPQDFGFVQLPQCIDIQPNDGFGTLLPLETFDLNVIFSPEIAKEYKFDLICKCLTNREFKLSCIGVGVHPPLELSHSLVQFRATAIYDASTVIIYVINSHTSLNELSHPASLVGKGEIAPVGPTAFEFAVPEHLDITVAPSVGTVMPGEKCLVRVTFRPKISDQAIKEEAVRMILLAEEGKILQEKTEKDESNTLKAESESLPYSVTKKSTRQTSPVTPVQASKEKTVKTSGTPKSNSSQIPFESPKMEDIQKDSDEYAAAQASLIRSFKDSVSTCIISCFVGTIANPNKPGSIQYSSSNTLYMEVRCPAVKPPLIVISNQGRNSLNFGDVATGHTLKKRIRVQNISHETVELSSSLFNPCGPFMLMNALRPLLPGATHTLLISFTPMENKKYYETLEVQTKNAALNLNLSGKGICPVVICSVEDGVLDFGCILAKENTSCFFKLQNTSPVTTDVSMKLDSLSVRLLMEQQEIPVFLTPGKERNSPVGTQNYHGLSVFSVSPAEVTIEPGKTHDISVIFQPDHESLYYSDRLQVELGDKVAHVITLKGAARNCAMYITGGDPLDVPVESLVELPTREDAEKGEATDVIPVLLTLKTTQKEDTLVPLQRELVVGCLKSTQPTIKKNVEFSFDNVQSLQHKGFTVDPSRGTVEPGQKKSISVIWMPPNGHDQRYPVSASALLTLKGDITEIYKVNLIAIIADA
ncbi:cilia- and flagella-associated protein 74 [Polypterus senegalus]|nr:cilia- and flagella-associated protein 74 [Polypterus senegalus]